MKIIIISLLCAGILSAKAQTQDTTFHFPSVKVAPFLNNPRTDTTNVTHVGIISGTFAFQQKMVLVNYGFFSDNQTLVASYQITLLGADFVGAVSATNKQAYFFTYLATHVTGITYQ